MRQLTKVQDGSIIVGSNLLAELSILKGIPLHVYLACQLFYADGVYPTVADIAKCTGYAQGSVSRTYHNLIATGYLEIPICSQCGQRTPIEKFHQHHVIPGGDKTVNICISCHNRQHPR